MTAEYLVHLSCGCEHWYSVWCHPFSGALLSCPDHGDVRQVSTGTCRYVELHESS